MTYRVLKEKHFYNEKTFFQTFFFKVYCFFGYKKFFSLTPLPPRTTPFERSRVIIFYIRNLFTKKNLCARRFYDDFDFWPFYVRNTVFRPVEGNAGSQSKHFFIVSNFYSKIFSLKVMILQLLQKSAFLPPFKFPKTAVWDRAKLLNFLFPNIYGLKYHWTKFYAFTNFFQQLPYFLIFYLYYIEITLVQMR